MRSFTDSEPLTDAQFDRLSEFLKSCKSGRAMNIEELDGFFSALIASPEPVMPSEYYREVFGGDLSEVVEFASLDRANEIFGLLTRHWNAIASKLYQDDIHVPVIFEDKHGELHGNDWARGFMRGMHMRHDAWSELANDEERGGCLVPMMILYHEHDEDPKMRPQPITPEKRERVIALMAGGLIEAYKYFREGPEAHANDAYVPKYPTGAAKVGRNQSCPCGSGKKYKRCCGAPTVN